MQYDNSEVDCLWESARISIACPNQALNQTKIAA